jgi:hypothetical protein
MIRYQSIKSTFLSQQLLPFIAKQTLVVPRNKSNQTIKSAALKQSGVEVRKFHTLQSERMA